jgi:hypothetical protein
VSSPNSAPRKICSGHQAGDSIGARSALARAQLQLGDPAAALATATTQRQWSYPAEEPVIRLLEGLALLELHRANEAA